MSYIGMDGGTEERLPLGYGGPYYGVYPAVVTDIADPDGQGRVKVKLPWSPDGKSGVYEVWARLATLMGGKNRGTWFIPDVEDEVLLSFQAGDPRWPFVVGALWNGKDTPPQSMDSAGANDVKEICSRNGVKITLNDKDGQESLTLTTPGGQTMELKDGPGVIEIKDSAGTSIKIDSAGITLTTSMQLSVTASAGVDITAGMVTVKAGMSDFSGVVKCSTLITNSVVSSSYTPGAGNLW